VCVSDVFSQVTGHVAGKLAERTRMWLSVHVRVEVPLQVVFCRESEIDTEIIFNNTRAQNTSYFLLQMVQSNWRGPWMLFLCMFSLPKEANEDEQRSH
jgi:hypothetical protein